MKRMSTARLSLSIDHPFFGYLLMGIHIVGKDGVDIDNRPLTIATDGNSIIFSRKYIQSLTNKELLFVLCHEVLHCALEHIVRRGKRDLQVWNVAVDIVVNEILTENKIGKAPRLVLRASNFFDEDVTMISAEEIYNKLIKDTKKKSRIKNKKTSGNFDQHHDSPQGQPANDKQRGNQGKKGANPFAGIQVTKIDWRTKVAEAIVIAKTRGSEPRGLSEEISIARDGYFPWQRYLEQYVSKEVAYDKTFNHPNRRYVSQGIYFPGEKKESITVVSAIDTSGSISSKEASLFLNETFFILDRFRKSKVKIIIIQCDAEIQEISEYNSWDNPPDEFKIKGRGGTDFRPVFDYLIENNTLYDILVYFTDGYGEFPRKNNTGKPVIWVMTTKDVEVPFGQEIYFPPLN
ncbi:MAG: vWA domain-containing protein [Candidatus Hodarchaeales archaeon]